MAIALGAPMADAAPRQPIETQGLELVDGRVATPPAVAGWGKATRTSPRTIEVATASLRRGLGPVVVSWDDARQVPSGIITAGTPAPGAVASGAVAEAMAWGWVSRHLDVLAPGSTVDDFALVSNDLSSGIRTVGFEQHHDGVRVVGGQLSLRFKHDRLVYVASQALPHVTVATRTAATVGDDDARAAARDWVELDFPGATLATATPEAAVILPVWSGDHWAYHEVVPLQVSSSAPLGQWVVYLDVQTGAPVAREQQMRSVVTVRFNVPERHPGAARYDEIAPNLDIFEGGQLGTTNDAGEIAVANSPTFLAMSINGPFVDVINSGGNEATLNVQVTDGSTVVWNVAGDEFSDAQLSAFAHTSLVKAFVRDIDPNLGWLDTAIGVNVNLEGSCNAASNGDDIFFLRAGQCQNTALLADVIYHEVGHSVHSQSIIPGVGAFNSALSEGISDYLAATIVDDSGMGRGFGFNDDPLRELDPVGSEAMWPDDISPDPHFTGLIIGGTLWDLRASLMAELGAAAGQAHADRIWYESVRRATDIPSMYPEALVYDDDDGDLTNGTPNGCLINAAFEAHGLLDPSTLGEVSVELVPVAGGRDVVVTQDNPSFVGCPVDATDAELRWRLRGDAQVDTSAMVLVDGDWVGTIPTQDTGEVVEYQVSLSYTTGAVSELPRNAADPWYQTYFGGVVPIYCLDDAADQGEWNFGGPGSNWSFGPLMGGGGIDPGMPYDDDGVLLSQDGDYPAGANTTASGPSVDISGAADVRLHYRRWLTVEDAVFDQATILANGAPIWGNLSTPSANTHHVDREWRFHDLPLSDVAVDGEVALGFALASDGGLEFGGWTVDGLCVVEVVDQACGDGWVSGDEQCDDGNTDPGDGCDARCQSEDEPDPPGTTGGETGQVDTGTVDDTGGSSGGGSVTSGLPGGTGGPTGADSDGSGDAGQDDAGASDGCGCTSGTGPGDDQPRGAWLWLLLVAGALRRRRIG